MQKSYGTAPAATGAPGAPTRPRSPAIRRPRRQRRPFPGGTTSRAPAAADRRPEAITGTVKLVDGTTVYVETADGHDADREDQRNDDRLATPGALKDLTAGSSVTIVGPERRRHGHRHLHHENEIAHAGGMDIRSGAFSSSAQEPAGPDLTPAPSSLRWRVSTGFALLKGFAAIGLVLAGVFAAEDSRMFTAALVAAAILGIYALRDSWCRSGSPPTSRGSPSPAVPRPPAGGLGAGGADPGRRPSRGWVPAASCLRSTRREHLFLFSGYDGASSPTWPTSNPGPAPAAAALAR